MAGRLRALLAAFAVLIAASAATTTAAQAAPVKFSFTDPSGDAVNGSAPADLVSGGATFDSVAGTLTVTETAAAPFGSTEGGFIFFLGQKTAPSDAAPDGCDYQTAQDGSNVTFLYAPVPGSTPAHWIPLTTDDVGGAQDGTLSQSGATITMTAVDPQGLLKGKSFSCLSVQSIQSGTDGPVDTAVAFLAAAGDPGTGGTDPGTGGGGAGGSGGATGTKSTTLLPVTAPVTTTDPDRDHDGIADSFDKCPTVPGAQKNGCPTMPATGEVRLGAARVAIDKLVLRTTAAKCPSSVTVKVTAKGKAVGSGKVSTSQFGSYCRVYGAVKIKIKKKVKAVRVTMKATGLGGIAKSAHR